MKLEQIIEEGYNQKWSQRDAINYVLEMIDDYEYMELEPGQLQFNSWTPVLQLSPDYKKGLRNPAFKKGLTAAINNALGDYDYCDSEEDCVDGRNDAIVKFLIKSKLATPVK